MNISVVVTWLKPRIIRLIMTGQDKMGWLFAVTVYLMLYNSSTVLARISVDPESGLYTGLTVKISDQVPRQFCKQTLDKLEVSLASKVTRYCIRK